MSLVLGCKGVILCYLCDGGGVGHLTLLGSPPVHQGAPDHVVRIGSRPLPCKIITDTVESLHCYRVASRIRSLPYVLGVTPSLPVALHHGAHLPVQEAVGQGDEESLEGEKNIPCENEDCLQSGVWF